MKFRPSLIPLLFTILLLPPVFSSRSFGGADPDGGPYLTAQAGQTDRVKITKARWTPRESKQRRLIVRARSRAPVGSVNLTAEVISDGKVIKSGLMVYKPEKGYYLKIFFNVYKKPDGVRVKSSGGGEDTVPVNFP